MRWCPLTVATPATWRVSGPGRRGPGSRSGRRGGHRGAQGPDVVFDVAGQVSHVDSMVDRWSTSTSTPAATWPSWRSIRTVRPGASHRAHRRPGRSTGGPATSPSTRSTPTRAGRRQRHRQAGVRAAPPPLRTRCTAPRRAALRLTNVYGPRQRLLARRAGLLPGLRAPGPAGRADHLSTATASQLRDCVHVDDVVDALVLASRTCDPPRWAQIFNLGARADALTARRDRRGRRPSGGARGEVDLGPVARGAGPYRHRQLRATSSKAKRPARLDAGSTFADGLARRSIVLPGSVPWSRRRPEPAAGPPLRPGIRRGARGRVLGFGHSVLLGAELDAFEREFAGGHRPPRRASPWRAGAAAIQLGARRARRAARATRSSSPRSPRCRPRRRCAPSGRSRCPSTSTPTPPRSTPASRSPRRHRRAPGPSSPSTSTGARRRSAWRLGLPVVEDAAQAHGALAGPARGRGRRATASTRRRTSAGSATAAPSSPTTPALAARVRRLPRPRPCAEQYVHVDVARTSGCRELEAAWLRLALPGLAADNDRRAAIAGRYRAAAPTLRGRPTTRDHVRHLCVAHVADRERRPRQPRGAGRRHARCTTRRRSRQQPAYQRLRRARRARSAEAWAAECVIAALLPRAHRRRGRTGRRARCTASRREPDATPW